MSTPISVKTVDALYKKYPEIEEPYYKNRKFLQRSKVLPELHYFHVTLPNNQKYLVEANEVTFEERWFLEQ